MKAVLTKNEFVTNFIETRIKEATRPSFCSTKEGRNLLTQHALAMYQLYVRSFR